MFVPASSLSCTGKWMFLYTWLKWNERTKWELLSKFKSSECLLHLEIPLISWSFDFFGLNLWSMFAWLRQARSSWEDFWTFLCLSNLQDFAWGCSSCGYFYLYNISVDHLTLFLKPRVPCPPGWVICTRRSWGWWVLLRNQEDLTELWRES